MSSNSRCSKQEGLPCIGQIQVSIDTTLEVGAYVNCLNDFHPSLEIVSFLGPEEVDSLLF